MLANPQLKDKKPERTRFKEWWNLIGSGIEHAAHAMVEHQRTLAQDSADTANAPAAKVDFVKLFAMVEVDDEDQSDLADVLRILDANYNKSGQFTPTFKAKDVSDAINEAKGVDPTVLRSFFLPSGKSVPASATPKLIGHRLGAIVDTPILVEDKDAGRIRHRTLKLVRDRPDDQARQRRVAEFRVKIIGSEHYPDEVKADNPTAARADDRATAPQTAEWDENAEAMFS